MNLAKQLTFRPDLPVILKNVDYLEREAQLKRMDELLSLTGIEEGFLEASLVKWIGDRGDSEVSGDAMLKQTERARRWDVSAGWWCRGGPRVAVEIRARRGRVQTRWSGGSVLPGRCRHTSSNWAARGASASKSPARRV